MSQNNILYVTKKIEYPILNFIVSFIIFIIVYSLISELFSKLSSKVKSKNLIIIKRIVQGILYLVFIVFLHYKNSVSYDYFKTINIKTLIVTLLIMFSFNFLYENTIQILIDRHFSNEVDDSTQTLEGIFSNPIAAFLEVCITAPIAEEILIRGYFFSTLNEKYSIFLTLIITSIFFAVLHFDFANTIFYLLMGIFFGIIVIQTGSITYCIILHFSLNFYEFISYYKRKYDSEVSG